MNRLIAPPIVAVLIGLAYPAVGLNGSSLYVEFLRQNVAWCVGLLVCWGLVLYWVTRRLADRALWRGSGRKLKLRERSGA